MTREQAEQKLSDLGYTPSNQYRVHFLAMAEALELLNFEASYDPSFKEDDKKIEQLPWPNKGNFA